MYCSVSMSIILVCACWCMLVGAFAFFCHPHICVSQCVFVHVVACVLLHLCNQVFFGE